MTKEKRRFSRIFFEVQAKITVGGVVYTVDQIVNLSVGGCLLEIEEDLPLGSVCTFTILLPQTASGIDVVGEIVRAGNGEVSLNFITITPENLFHLQNIVRYNAKDPDLIEEEISAHPGLK
ncbi:MAG: PilZ domain-containing protein [Desulforhopalus sp.]